MNKMKLLLAIIIISFIGAFLYYNEGLLPANSKDTTPKIFVIERGKSVNNIIKSLHSQGLIRDRIVFYLIIKRMGIENKIQAGDFRLYPAMTAEEIAKNLTQGSLDVWVTIIEGTRKEEIAQILAKELGIQAIEFNKQAREGYLFPDTYLMPKKSSISSVLTIFEKNFNTRYNEDLRKKARSLSLTDEEVVTLASMVEREAKTDQDRQIVASIMLKRLRDNWGLDIDATIQYAIGYQDDSQTWWKAHLTRQDLEIDSPYNTYKYKGLPPTPIGNPGLSSIKAVVNADHETPYWFYISSRDGSSMHYAKTIDEHNANIKKYLR